MLLIIYGRHSRRPTSPPLVCRPKYSFRRNEATLGSALISAPPLMVEDDGLRQIDRSEITRVAALTNPFERQLSALFATRASIFSGTFDSSSNAIRGSSHPRASRGVRHTTKTRRGLALIALLCLRCDARFAARDRWSIRRRFDSRQGRNCRARTRSIPSARAPLQEERPVEPEARFHSPSACRFD